MSCGDGQTKGKQILMINEQEAFEIGVEAFTYLYSMVLMDVTRRQATNIEAGKVIGRGPMNAFTHVPIFPPADFRDVVRPNFDTLYSIAWLDLTKEPMVVTAPDTHDRYYMLPMLDMWTDVFACPGKRTTGTGAGQFAIAPQAWQGKIPGGVQRIDAPTPFVWIIGRTQTNGTQDYEAVHKVQAGYTITPLSQLGKAPLRARRNLGDPRSFLIAGAGGQLLHHRRADRRGLLHPRHHRGVRQDPREPPGRAPLHLRPDRQPLDGPDHGPLAQHLADGRVRAARPGALRRGVDPGLRPGPADRHRDRHLQLDLQRLDPPGRLEQGGPGADRRPAAARRCRATDAGQLSSGASAAGTRSRRSHPIRSLRPCR